MSDFLVHKPLVLASGSPCRQQLLQSLGLEFEVIVSGCDEESIKQQFTHHNYKELARTLAAAKALAVSSNFPSHFVIAADQLCVIEDQYLDKPGTHEVATSHLRLLRGKTHQQIAACCIAWNNQVLWENQEIALLTMRDLSDTFIETYLRLDKPYQSCGAYNYEGRAKWLFQQVEGSDCTILGLPLIPLIQALISLEVVKS